MEIADHTGSHDVTISDEVGDKLLGCKADFLSEMSKKVSFFLMFLIIFILSSMSICIYLYLFYL